MLNRLCRYAASVGSAAVLLALPVLGTATAQDRPLPDFGPFLAEVKKRLATDEERQAGYMFTERRVEQKLDASGRTKDESVKVFEVYPGLPGEDRYRRLIEEDGKPIAADKLAEEDRARQKEVEAFARKLASGPERAKTTRNLEKERQRYAAAIDDISRVYDIRLVRREVVDGHDTIVATLTPKPDAKPETDDGMIMRHFKARAWISESDYELVRVEIEAVENLSFGFGLLARVHKGTVATYQRRRVNNEVWLPEKVTWTASARVMLLKSLRLRGVSEFSKYRKFTVDTTTTYTRPPA
ncbi:MAG: hypothetical protein C5B57_04110 [Blastocatellia bacterium]|nr:MAG: hypothetical protein C5B57_04110 [Blastocatellia bacterium]